MTPLQNALLFLVVLHPVRVAHVFEVHLIQSALTIYDFRQQQSVASSCSPQCYPIVYQEIGGPDLHRLACHIYEAHTVRRGLRH